MIDDKICLEDKTTQELQKLYKKYKRREKIDLYIPIIGTLVSMGMLVTGSIINDFTTIENISDYLALGAMGGLVFTFGYTSFMRFSDRIENYSSTCESIECILEKRTKGDNYD